MDRGPQVVVCDHDAKLSTRFADVFRSSGVCVVRTAILRSSLRMPYCLLTLRLKSLSSGKVSFKSSAKRLSDYDSQSSP